MHVRLLVVKMGIKNDFYFPDTYSNMAICRLEFESQIMDLVYFDPRIVFPTGQTMFYLSLKCS